MGDDDDQRDFEVQEVEADEVPDQAPEGDGLEEDVDPDSKE